MLGFFKLLRNDDLDETTKLCEEAYDYNSDDRDIKDNLSICYFRKGEYEKAEKTVGSATVAAACMFPSVFWKYGFCGGGRPGRYGGAFY